ncbi:MAG TPA: sulfotransferase, partial [Polyangiaceae bacterium]
PMYVHVRSLGWLTSRGLVKGPLSLRLTGYAFGFGLVHGLLGGTVSLARWLDGLVYPTLELAPIPAPVFVLATPRSGTTYLHQLLALDEERFASCRLYQTIVPSILLERAIDWLRGLRGPAGSVLGALVGAIDSRMFTDWDGIHRVSLSSWEEDESLFVYSLTSPALYLLFPFIREIPEFVEITRLGRRTIRRVASDYRQTVQRWVYTSGNQRTPLIKNVLLPSRLPVAARAFPDARYVHVVRDPREAIPSAVSMFHTMWQSHSPGIAADSPATRALADMFLTHYRLLCEEGRKQPPDRWIQVRYDDLIRDPIGTVERIYSAFGYSVGAEFRARLEQAAAQGRSFKSRHQYALEQFGLTEGDLREGLGEHWDGLRSASP